MQKRWVVELSQNERTQLEQLIQTGKVAGYKIRHAHMLLQADESELGPSWSDVQVAEAYHTSITTVRNLRKRLVEKGFEAALEREKQANRKIKFDGDTEAKLVALACSEAPEGYSKWSVRLLANRMIECEIVDEISPMTVQRMLKKINLSLG